MGVGSGLYMYVVVVQKFTFAISSPDEFLYYFVTLFCMEGFTHYLVFHVFQIQILNFFVS